MINQQLLDYIKQQSNEGASQEQIKNSLSASGWQENDIRDAFSVLASNTTSRPYLSASATLREAWSLYKQRLSILLGIAAISAAFIMLTAVVSFYASILTSIMWLLVIMASIWSQIAIIYAIQDNQKGIGVFEAYRRGWHKLFNYWWVVFLVGAVTTGGLFLFIIPGIVFMVWFCLAGLVLITEDTRGINALLKSREYVRGKWGSMFWRLIFINLYFLIMVIAIIIPFSIIAALIGGAFIGAVNIIMQLIVYFVIAPLAITYLFLVYKNFRDAKPNLVFSPTKKQKNTFFFIAMLGPIIAIAIIAYVTIRVGTYRARSRDTSLIRGASIIRHQLMLYRLSHGQYPLSLEALFSEPNAITIPSNPEMSHLVQYQRISATDYELCVQLETQEDKCISSGF